MYEDYLQISKKKLSDLYMKEMGKLILDFPVERYNQYSRIIMETKSYVDVLRGIPDNLSKIEKVYYVYNNLGRQLYENDNLVYNHINNLHMYYGTILENGIGNCRQMSELFVTMLRMSNLIENFYLVRKPVGVELLDLRHINAIIQVDGNLYMTDIIRDTVNMRAGIRNSKFGFIDTKEKRLKELKNYFFTNAFLSDEVKKSLVNLINESNYYDLLSFANKYRDKTGVDVGVNYLERLIPKIEFVEQLADKFSELTQIPQKLNSNNLSIELLDEKIHNVRKYDDIGFPFNLSLGNYRYFEDILEYELIPKLSRIDSDIRKKWCLSKNIMLTGSLDENIEIDVDVILFFFYTIAPNIDPEICLKYLKVTLERIYFYRQKFRNIVTKEWIENHIKLYKIIEEKNLSTKGFLSLRTLLSIRKDEIVNEKYIFYIMQREKKPQKISYDYIVNQAYLNQMKICSKFSTKREEFVKKLQL